MGKKLDVHLACGFILILLFVIPLFGSQERSSNEPRFGGVFRLKSFSDTFSMEFDPTQAESSIFILEQIYDGLVRLDKNLSIVPCLAEYWEISPDGKKHTFYLRRGVKFHHGRELSAEDVKFSLERILDKKTNSPYYQFFLPRIVGAKEFREGKTKDVAGFKVIDKYSFEIHWTKPFVSALYLMSMHFCKILPRDLVLDQGRRFFLKPSGTGPFKFDYWLRTPKLDIVGVRLKRNESYFGGRPYLGAIEFCPLFTLDHFLNREIDSIPVLSEKLLSSDFQVFKDGLLQPVFLGMSCNIPPLGRTIVRQAILHSLDKSEIARDIFDMKYVRQVMNNYIPSRLPGFFPRDDEGGYDPEKAKLMLQEAGFSSEKKFPPLTLFIDMPRTEMKLKFYRALRKQLGALGIKLRLNYYRSLKEIKSYNKPYLVYTGRVMSFPDPEDIIRPLFFSKSIFNVFSYANPELDRLLQEAEVERSWTKRINLFHKIEHILVTDVPAIPLFSHQNRVAMQPYVRGVEVPSLGFYYLNTRKIWLDK
jgi:ABC-type transport system substrate-binding protein